MNLLNIKKIHFIGIGGIGVSAIARMMLEKGKLVSGSNTDESKVTDELKKLGATVYVGHNEKNLDDDVDLVVYSPAIPEDNVELVKARGLNISCLSYPEALGVISKGKYTIAVSGTHGKTTTTAMLADVLIDGGVDPTVIVGSLLIKQNSNFIHGDSEYFLVEACEYKRSFLNLQPNILVVTNVDEDHLDYYKDLADIQSAFRELALKTDGYIVCNPSDVAVKPVLEGVKSKIVDYTQYVDELDLKMPGDYNIQNAQVGLAVADVLGLGNAVESLNDFAGTWRRFEFKGKTKNGTLVYDDYAHNPTEIKSLLYGARKFFVGKKITVVFQPHLYSRTKIFFDDFVESFGDADRVVVLPIYAAREKNDLSINSEMLVEKIPNAVYSDFDDVVEKLGNLGSDDVVLTVGAGETNLVAEEIVGCQNPQRCGSVRVRGRSLC